MFLCQIWTWLKGVGPRIAGLASQRAGLLDWLADLIKDIFVAIIAHSIVWQYITANCKRHLLTGRITQTFQEHTIARKKCQKSSLDNY